MTRTIAIIAAAGAASVSALSLAYADTQSYDFSGFTMIDASAGVDVEVTVGGAYSVRAEGEAEALERLRIERDGDALEIGRTHDRSFFSPGRKWQVTVYVTMPELNGVDVSSGADVKASGIDAGDFNASVSSGSDAVLSGRCRTITADGSSGADLDARELKCENAVADVSSGADLIVYATESLEADASSGGDITVYGSPKNTNIDKSSGGGVSIR
ncbi:head GIN domain-containing protein [Hyphococcus sp.]|uniref:head GIN domain-containing protein n=1 Tax=Hyphococcus sp. TaxID=2038636 RepID=UPI003D108DCE